MEDHKKIENRTCPNCYYPMSNAHTDYCSNCGQKYKTGRVTFWELISEAFSLLFNFDNKFFKTAGAIFIPGRLTKRFFKGKHKSFVHPVRVLLVSTLVMIFALNHHFENIDIGGPTDMYEELKESDWKYKKSLELDTLRQDIVADFKDNPQVIAALDSLVTRSHFDDLTEDSIRFGKNNIGFLQKDIAIAREDIFNLTDVEIVDKYEVEDPMQRMVWRQTIRVVKRGDRLLSFLLGNILWLVIIMMPLLALALRLLYVRRDFYFVEHFVFSMHTHSFAFILMTAYIFFADTLPSSVIGFMMLSIAVFVIIAMKQFYKQSWQKTVLKFTVINFLYIILICFSMVITLLLSLALF